MNPYRWHTLDEKPAGVFDVLARHYDAGLNSFLIQRFTGCVEQDSRILWCSPFPGDGHTVDLANNGYRVVRWQPAPGKENLPLDLAEFAAGPPDVIERRRRSTPGKAAGGVARAKSLSPARRREIAQTAAKKRWGLRP